MEEASLQKLPQTESSEGIRAHSQQSVAERQQVAEPLPEAAAPGVVVKVQTAGRWCLTAVAGNWPCFCSFVPACIEKYLVSRYDGCACAKGMHVLLCASVFVLHDVSISTHRFAGQQESSLRASYMKRQGSAPLTQVSCICFEDLQRAGA